MLFMVIWTFKPSAAEDAIARFSETGGLPPDGVTMVSRYHVIGGNRGFAVAESDDPIAMGSWTRQWNDLLSFEVIPVVDDAGIQQILASRSG